MLNSQARKGRSHRGGCLPLTRAHTQVLPLQDIRYSVMTSKKYVLMPLYKIRTLGIARKEAEQLTRQSGFS